MEDEENRSHQASTRGSVIPAQLLMEVEGHKYAEDQQRDHFLDHFQLHHREAVRAEAVGRNLKAVFEEGNAPTDEDDLPKRLLTKAQVTVPGKGHEDVGEDQ